MLLCFLTILIATLQITSAFLNFEGNKVYLFNIDSEYTIQQKNPIRNIADGTSAFMAVRTKDGNLFYSIKGSSEQELHRQNLQPINIANKNYDENLEDNALATLMYDLRPFRKYFTRKDFPEKLYKKIRLPMGTCNATIVIERRTHLTTVTITGSTKVCMISRKFMAELRGTLTQNTVIDEIQNELNIEYSNKEQNIKEIKITSFVDTHVRQTKIHTVRKVALKYVGAVTGIMDWEQKLLMQALSGDRSRRN
uniref:CSON001199 protein n=1 Tax=Culicoides sonorensis TaxID=179676 RepID=A0A336MKI5_CULSO